MLAGLLALLTATSTPDQTAVRHPSLALERPAIPAEMVTVLARFKEALRRDSPEDLAAITNFPLLSNDLGGRIDTPQLLRQRWRRIFTEARRRCLLKSELSRWSAETQQGYELFCDVELPLRFIFERTANGWRFTAIDNINE